MASWSLGDAIGPLRGSLSSSNLQSQVTGTHCWWSSTPTLSTAMQWTLDESILTNSVTKQPTIWRNPWCLRQVSTEGGGEIGDRVANRRQPFEAPQLRFWRYHKVRIQTWFHPGWVCSFGWGENPNRGLTENKTPQLDSGACHFNQIITIIGRSLGWRTSILRLSGPLDWIESQNGFNPRAQDGT